MKKRMTRVILTLILCFSMAGSILAQRGGCDGQNETRLTDAPGLDDGPEFTPDGKSIAYLVHNKDEVGPDAPLRFTSGSLRFVYGCYGTQHKIGGLFSRETLNLRNYRLYHPFRAKIENQSVHGQKS